MVDPGTHSSGTLTSVAVGLTGPALLGLSVSTGILQGHTQGESTPSSSVGRCQIGEASKPHRHIFDSDKGLQAFQRAGPTLQLLKAPFLPPPISHTFQGKNPFYSLRQILSFQSLEVLGRVEKQKASGQQQGRLECPTPPLSACVPRSGLQDYS